VTRTGGATRFVLLTRGWKSVSSKQCSVKLTLLHNCCVQLFNKVAWTFHVALCGEVLLGDGLQNSDVSESFITAFIRRLNHTYDCVMMVEMGVTAAPLSPFSYCPDGAVLNVGDTQHCEHYCSAQWLVLKG
jgi:di/tricarboxylate transporter